MKRIINCIYYFFNGLLFLIILIPNLFIKVLNIIFKKEFSEIKVSRREVILLIIISCFSMYFISIFYLTRYYVQQERCKVFSKQIIKLTNEIEKEEEIIQENELPSQPTTNTASQQPATKPATNNYTTTPSYLNYLDIDVNNYTRINKDVVAWLKVNGTKVNYAIVQSKNNKYYLKKDLYNRDSITGWVFADYRNNFQELDKNNIIYGHNMANGTMFGTLTRVTNKSWYSKTRNQYIALNTKNAKTIWKIFSIYIIEPTTDYLQVIFENNNSYEQFLRKMKARSIYNFATDISANDKILTLQTCDNSGAKRIVVQAKLYKIEKS